MTTPARILHLEDSDLDAELARLRLQKGGVAVTIVRAVDRGEFIEQLTQGGFDLVLSDYQVPGFDGLEALRLAKDHLPETPFIFLSGAMGEEVAVETLRLGATDYVLKQRLARLPSAIQRALTDSRLRAWRRSAERTLSEQQNLFRTTLSSIGDGVICTDIDARVTFLNAEAERLSGWRSAEAVGQPVTTVFQIVHPRSGQAARCPVGKVLQTRAGAVSEIHTDLVARDDKRRPVESQAAPIRNEEGQLLGVVLVFRDITDRLAAEAMVRQSEARFRSLVTASAQIVWTTSPDGQVVDDSPSWRSFTGQSYDEWKGWGWLDAVHPDDRPAAAEVWARAVADRSIYHTEYRIRRHDGVYRWTAVRGVPVLNDDGSVREWVGTNTDVTELKGVEAEREALLESERAARSEAERASRMKDEFLATLSHELRTPLSAILGYASLLGMGGLSEADLQETAETIERNAQVQAQLIDDLLDMNRIVSGKVRLHVQQVDLAAVIEAAMDTVRPSADARGVRLEADVDPRAEPVQGDPNRLQQVVWNLLSNAIKFTQRGGRVDVSLTRKSGHLQLAVTDTGDGIPPDFLPHVFDRFRQADASTTRHYGGLGIGLAIVKHLVELHGGQIHAASAGLGHGAQFTVTLPLITGGFDDSHDEQTSRPAVRTTQRDSDPDLAHVRILVVDDEPDACELVKRILERCHASVRVAQSAAAAFELFAADRFDLLISDIGMPSEDGYSLIRRIRAHEQQQGGELPAIALTAFARPEDRQRALTAGFQAHLTKPVDRRHLLQTAAHLTTPTESKPSPLHHR